MSRQFNDEIAPDVIPTPRDICVTSPSPSSALPETSFTTNNQNNYYPDGDKSPISKESSFSILDTVIALYEFPATAPSHLPLHLGDTIYVISKSATGWWDGVCSDNSGELQRGWFPHSFVRSVNYVQPVLNKLKDNKELDLITAANTAANVLIPSFTSLLQKNLQESDKNSSGNATRKNSVVSFASSETSIPSDSKYTASSNNSTGGTNNQNYNNSNIQLPQQKHSQTSSAQISPISQPSLSPFIDSNNMSQQHSITNIGGDGDEVILTETSEAEQLMEHYSSEHNKTPVWLPRYTNKGDFVFYCQQLDIYCESVPLSIFNPEAATPNLEFPDRENLECTAAVHVHGNKAIENALENQEFNSSRPLDTFKRDSHTSMTTQSSGSSYHQFRKPFFAMDHLFYKHASDITYWTQLKTDFYHILEMIRKSLNDQNSQFFSTHFTRLNKLILVILGSLRLNRDDYIDTDAQKPLRKEFRKIYASLSQIYMISILHLNVLKNDPMGKRTYDEDTQTNYTFTLNETSDTTHDGFLLPKDQQREGIKDQSTEIDIDHYNLKEPQEYLNYLHRKIEELNLSTNFVIETFIKLSEGKYIKKTDYDLSDTSDDEGEDRYDVVPQAFPRFLADEFNGGNWCNPFFPTSHSILNVSGDDLKNRCHTKIIIDHQAYDSLYNYSEAMINISQETLEYLDSQIQETYYYNETLKTERNGLVLKLIYKYLYHASSMIDLIESFDFTVFCLIKKYSSLNEDEEHLNYFNLGTNNLNNEKMTFSKSNLAFDYPVVLQFFQLKQELHNSILRIIMSTQSLTLEDTQVFKGLKDEDPLFYNKDILKLPLEKTALLLSNVLFEQLNDPNKFSSISINADDSLSEYLNSGINACQVILEVTQKLIEERETIINYATRVMNDDFDVQLLLMERNNTISSEKSEEHSYYSGGHKRSKDIPWYLEGDEEFDLLLDVKGNIKGGTKEALVAHLTHHDMFDSTFNAVFLLTFASMMSLNELITSLISRFQLQAPEGLNFEEYNIWISKKLNPIRLRVMNIMKLLIEKHWSKSYYKESILQKWLKFSESPQVSSFSIGKMLASDLKKLLEGESLCVERAPIISDVKPPAPLIKGSTLSRKIKLMDIDYVELARQLTLREFHLYCKITKYACLAKVWGKKSGLDESISSITAFIKASNQLTNFVAYMILRKSDPKKRIQIIRYFIQVAEKCRQYNNFSSMTAIISALYSSPIHRLKKTWDYVSSESIAHLKNMNKLMNSSRNFNEYRDVLKFIGSEPCVPFFGVYLSDLTFVYHGNPDYLINRTKLINFAKRAKTSEIVSGIDRFKTIGYNFQEVFEIQRYLDSWFEKCPPIEEQYQISLNLEPREQQSISSSSNNKTYKSPSSFALRGL